MAINKYLDCKVVTFTTPQTSISKMPTIPEYFGAVGLSPPVAWKFTGFRDAYQFTWNNYFITRQSPDMYTQQQGALCLQKHMLWCADHPSIHKSFDTFNKK